MTFQELMDTFHVNMYLNNTVVYKEILAQLKINRLTPVIGAGLSVWAGYPLWGNLIRDLADGTNCEDKIYDYLLNGEYEKAASLLEEEYGRNCLVDVLTRVFSPEKLDESKRPKYQKLLPKLFKGPFVTTNFDVSLEKLLNNPFVVDPQYEFHREETLRKLVTFKQFLIKLQGTMDDPRHIIFTKESYDSAYGEDEYDPDETKPLLQQLKTIFHSSPPLFLGCNLGSNDRLSRVFEKCIRENGFALLEMPGTNEEFKKRRREMDKMGIKVIWHPKGRYDAVEVLIRQLATDIGIDPDMPVIDKKMTVQEQQYKNSVNFLGRDEIVQKIFGYMSNPNIPAVIVNGPAGVGKTEICKAVYWKLKRKILDFSMPFIDLAGFGADDVIPSIAKALGIFREDVAPEQLFETLKLFLAGNKKTYYVYLDNFEDVLNNVETEKQYVLFHHLKDLTNVGLKLLISSRVNLPFGNKVIVPELDSNKDMETMPYDKLLKTDSGKLFVKTLGRKLKTYEQNSFITLMREIDGHPLSIILMATYCRQSDSINDVKDKWSETEINVPTEHSTYESLRNTLQLSWQQVSKSKAAVFIWALHTYSIYPLDDDIVLELNKFAEEPFSEDDLTDGQNVLRNYGLVNTMDDGKAHMQPRIKKIFETFDETGDFKAEIELAFSAWIKWYGDLLKRGNDRKDKERDKYFNTALDWLPECFSLAEQCLDKQKYDELAILLADAGNYYQFDVVRSVPLLTRLTQKVPKEFPLQSSWHLLLGDLLNRTGNVEGALQSYDEAERLFKKERNNLGLANVLQSRGDLLRRTGKQGEALQSYDEAQRLYRRENDNLGFANVLSSKGDLLMNSKNVSDAKICYEKALDLYRDEQILEFVGYALFDLIICCAQLDDKNGLETYTRELQQILPLLPEHTKKSINKTFTMLTNRNTTS